MVGASVLLTWTLLSKTFNELALSILFPLPGAVAGANIIGNIHQEVGLQIPGTLASIFGILRN